MPSFLQYLSRPGGGTISTRTGVNRYLCAENQTRVLFLLLQQAMLSCLGASKGLVDTCACRRCSIISHPQRDSSMSFLSVILVFLLDFTLILIILYVFTFDGNYFRKQSWKIPEDRDRLAQSVEQMHK